MRPHTPLRWALKALSFSRIPAVLSPLSRGFGAILTLHHVLPEGRSFSTLEKNKGLECSAAFLDDFLADLKRKGYRFVSLKEAYDVLMSGQKGPPFVVFTLDDGYLDNKEHAWPIFQKHHCPFTLFVTTDIVDGVCELWWRAIEEVVLKVERLEPFSKIPSFEPLVSLEDKNKALSGIYAIFRDLPQDEQRRLCRAFCGAHGVDVEGLCRSLAMTWDDVRAMSKDPLCEIGAHTVKHFSLAHLSEEDAAQEIIQSKQRLEAELGLPVTSFAYPYGGSSQCGPREYALVAKAGFTHAVTTHQDVVRARYRGHPSALPRLSVHGLMQDMDIMHTLLSGVPSFFNWLR